MKKKQVQNQAQEGRSMVEMLGVLAIIGVISIGGISGYRMAMNRYQANQIANEINLMRTDAKMKVARGVEELLLGSPYDDEKHLNFNANYGVKVDFPVTISDEEGGEEGYSFTLSGIPAGVCKPLATLLDGMDDTAVLEINGKDYETAETLCDNEENEVLVAFSTKDLGGIKVCNPEKCPGECTENGECECPEGSHLSGDECVTCSDEAPWNGSECACPEANEYWNGNVCVGCKGGTWDNDTKTCTCTSEEQTWNVATGECTCSSENQHWNGSGCVSCERNEVWNEVDGQCEVPESYCRTNADCNKEGKKGYFCYTRLGKDCYIEFEDGGNRNSGTCKLVSSFLKKKAKIGGTTYYGTTSNMTWWSACRFCAARKGADDGICKSGTSGTTGTTEEPDFMAGYEMLQCADKIDVDNQKTGYCHESEAGNTSRADDNISEKVKDLREMYGCSREDTSCDNYPWLRDSYSSCRAYRVRLGNGSVSDVTRYASNGLDYIALCE